MSHHEMYVYFDIVDDDDVYCILSTFSQQTLKKIEVITVIVSSEVSKLNHSVMNKKLFTCHPKTSCRLISRFINCTSNLSICLKMFVMQWRKNINKIKNNEYSSLLMFC